MNPLDEAELRAKLATVITLPSPLPGLDDLASFLAEKLLAFDAADDVYHPVFAERGDFIFQAMQMPSTGSADIDITTALQNIIDTLFPSDYARSTACYVPTPPYGLLPEGPYLYSGGAIYQAWRLYPDDLRAFVLATLPSSVSGFVCENRLVSDTS